MADFDLDAHIRKVPDFPKAGIVFYDITSVMMSPEAFGYCIDAMVERYRERGIEGIAAIDARGFLFAAPLARELKLPLLLVRKKGKLPGETISREFELEYGSDVVEMHRADLSTPRRLLLVDDLIATGGTLRAAADMIRESGSSVEEIFAVIGLPFLNYAALLDGIDIHTLIEYHGE